MKKVRCRVTLTVKMIVTYKSGVFFYVIWFSSTPGPVNIHNLHTILKLVLTRSSDGKILKRPYIIDLIKDEVFCKFYTQILF